MKPIGQNLTKLSRFGPTAIRCKNFPKGFLASGVYCGIKKKPSTITAGDTPTIPTRDVGLIVSKMKETHAAGCFTKNIFKAAPVKYSIAKLKKSGGSNIRGIVINSGCANAVTGNQGNSDAAEMGRLLDEYISGVEQDASASSLVLSTGVIGQLLPMEQIRKGIAMGITELKDSYEGWRAAAEAFMTTDTFPKLLTHSFNLGDREIRFAGIVKGAGMIHPAMGPPHATLLGCIVTDAAVGPVSLQMALTHAVEKSFNRISVDGDMSTNDAILVLANGAAGNKTISLESNAEDFLCFQQELTQFALQLAKLIVRDGEGATKFVKVRVVGAESEEDATQVAATVATSSLVKCALNGEDANWGRILCAVGYSKVDGIDPTQVSVSIKSPNGTQISMLENGEPVKVDEVKASQILKEEDFEIYIDLGKSGGQESSYFTCDFSKEYVAINGDYRS